LADFKKFSPLKPLGQMNRNLVGSIYGRSSLKIAYFVPICYQAVPPLTILASDWLISKKSSPLKPLGQMNRNLVGSIYGRSSLKIAYFVTICYQAVPPLTILVSDWLISKKSSPL
jgi:acetyl-CoA carboxylase carboxyltransferase component